MKPSNLFKLTLIGASLVLTSACATAQSPQGEPPEGAPQGQPPSVENMFSHMDADQDGLLSKSEVKGPLQNDFDKVDANSDGYISLEELKNAPKPQGHPRRPQN